MFSMGWDPSDLTGSLEAALHDGVGSSSDD